MFNGSNGESFRSPRREVEKFSEEGSSGTMPRNCPRFLHHGALAAEENLGTFSHMITRAQISCHH